MENEMLKIFDDQRNPIGTATREEVHRLGYWHEVFHCWFVSREGGKTYIYLQLRSKLKKDYPNLLDITAAGHLLAHETISDGVREIEEELGIDVSIEDLIPLGIIEYCVTRPGFIDKELAHVYLYEGEHFLDDARLQREEVTGLVRTEFDSFCKMWHGEIEEIKAEGFVMKDDQKVWVERMVGKNHFVPHEIAYYENVIQWMMKNKMARA
ncbi:NUDIX hydrolase [Marinicrinis lubricantis]|uniref:NUDIX domain-containing protein n=1 Tax=Marinicrinis lubricantis TaxID=2086470 RepID=A0ABW1IQ09_9BACL